MGRNDLMLIVAALLGFAALLLRRLSTSESRVGAFLHSANGAAVMAVVSAAIGAAVPLLQAGVPVRDVILGGISAATAAVLAVASPAPRVAALLVLLVPSLALADMVPPPDGGTGTPRFLALFLAFAPVVVIAAGLLVGYGTRMGSGCTSGHGVCGLSRMSPRSLVATLAFMAAGFAVVFVVRHVL